MNDCSGRQLKPIVLAVLSALGLTVFASPPGIASRPVALSALDSGCPPSNLGLAGPSSLDTLVPTFVEVREDPSGKIRFRAQSSLRSLEISELGPSVGSRTANGRRSKNKNPDTVSTVDLVLLNALKGGSLKPECELPTRSHYFVGSDRSKWVTDASHFARVRHTGVYSGIDLLYYVNDRSIEYDFIAAPGANPGQIAFAVKGGDVRLNAAGDLVIGNEVGALIHRRPVAYQVVAGHTSPVEASFRIAYDSEADLSYISFDIGNYDRAAELVIDPVLDYSSYLGASGGNGFTNTQIGQDASGFVYLAAANGTGLIDVYKIDTVANVIKYHVALGGSGTDNLYAMRVDAAGKVYLAGDTTSANFPKCFATTDCVALSGNSDAFAVRLGASGGIEYSRLLGGSGDDSAHALAIDLSGNMYLAGSTSSLDFPLVSPLYPVYRGGLTDAFVAKLVPTNVGGVVYSTYLGGSGADYAEAIALGASGDMFIAGSTSSMNFPTINAIQGFAGASDAFIAKIGASGSSLQFSSFLGGSGGDVATAIDFVQGLGPIYIAGRTAGGFPVTPGARQTTYGGGLSDAFVTRLGASGAGFVVDYATYLGGSGDDSVQALVTDGTGGIYLTGATTSGVSFPRVNMVSSAESSSNGVNSNAFVTHVLSSGALEYSTLLGGSGDDAGTSLTRATGGGVWVGGKTQSSNFPRQGALQNAFFGPSLMVLSHIGNPLTLLGVKSRKTHGGAGTYDLAIDIGQSINGPITVEPRAIGGGHKIVFQFNAPVRSLGSVSVSPIGTATATFSGNDVLVTLTNLADKQRVTVTLANVNGSGSAISVPMGFYVGDVNNDRFVDTADILQMKARVGQVTTAANFRFDLNASGIIDSVDLDSIKLRAGPLP